MLDRDEMFLTSEPRLPGEEGRSLGRNGQRGHGHGGRPQQSEGWSSITEAPTPADHQPSRSGGVLDTRASMRSMGCREQIAGLVRPGGTM